MTARSSPERALSDAILLEVGGASGIRLWRQNSGLARGLHSEGRIRLAPAGASDLVGIVSLPVPHLLTSATSRYLVGVHLAIETKSERGRQTKDQQSFQAMIERLDGIYILARSVEDVWEELELRGFVRLTSASK